MSLLRTNALRSLPRATARAPARSTAGGPARFQRRYATEEGGKPKNPDGKKPMPVAGIAVALTIPALAWFFMGTSRKDMGAAGAAKNEDMSKSVPVDQPEHKEKKPANPKAVAPDGSRLDSEKLEKRNTLTGTNK